MAKQEQAAGAAEYKEKERIANPSQAITDNAAQLVKYGGFDLIETSVEAAGNMNPTKKARKNIFLTENVNKQERKKLKKRLQLWADLLEGHENAADMIAEADQKANVATTTLNRNLKKAIDQTAELEKAYRAMALFYKNAEAEKIKNISFINADMDQIADLDNTVFVDHVANELRQNYDRLDLRNNYSIMVVPGYMGGGKVIDKWAKLAYENKVMMLTDYRHLDTPDDVMELFADEDLASADAYKSNVMMTCNYLVGREAYTELGEEEPLYVAPSAAMAGQVYKTLMSQVAAGKKHGSLSEVDGVRFDLKKSEIASLERMGLIPMVNEYGKVMAYSAKTLFNGDNLGLQTYSVVRVFDWVMKVLIDFLNRRAFENWTYNSEQDLRKQIVTFLNNITGPGKIIEDFKIQRFERDPNQKDRVFLDIHITPYFPAKNFLIRLDGTRGDDGANWEGGVQQQ